MNLPNSITLARICSVPFFLWILASSRFAGTPGRQEMLAAAVFLLASLTDGIDGVIARRTHQVTTLGMLLSPLADKLLVATAYISLVHFAPTLVSAWIAFVIVGREFLVTGLQSVAVQEGMTLGVRDIGKVKTVVQILSVTAVLMAHAWPQWTLGASTFSGERVAILSIWLMLAVSLLSAAAYFRAFLREALKQMRRNRPAPIPFPLAGKNAQSSR